MNNPTARELRKVFEATLPVYTDQVEKLLDRFKASVMAVAAMQRRMTESLVGAACMWEHAERDDHQLLTAQQCREEGDKLQRRSWIQRDAGKRLAALAARRLREQMAYERACVEQFNVLMAELPGIYLTTQNPYR